MILKVAFVQPICDQTQHDLRKSKEGLNKKETTSFASILGKIIKSQSTGK